MKFANKISSVFWLLAAFVVVSYVIPKIKEMQANKA